MRRVPPSLAVMAKGNPTESFCNGTGTPFSVLKNAKNSVLWKRKTPLPLSRSKNKSYKLEEVNACILAMYPTLSTNLPLSDYTNEELIAHELCEDIFSDFIRFGHILIEVVRKEVVYEN